MVWVKSQSIYELSDLESAEVLSYLQGGGVFERLDDAAGEAKVLHAKHSSLLFKHYSIKRFKQKIRSRFKIKCPKFGYRYGWAEIKNTEQAANLGCPTVCIKAYYENVCFASVSDQLVVYEYLAGYRTLDSLFLDKNFDGRSCILSVEKLIYHMCCMGVFHMDLNSKNIMFLEGDIRVVDFEYAVFNCSKKVEMYFYYFGYLYQKWLRHKIDIADYSSWVFGFDFNRHMFDCSDLKRTAEHWFELGCYVELSRADRMRVFL